MKRFDEEEWRERGRKGGGEQGEIWVQRKERGMLIAVNCIEEKKIYEFTNIKCVNYTCRYSASIIRAPLSTS